MSAEKICNCDAARWPKCAHPWYLPKLRWQGHVYKPNLTRYALEVLEPARELKTKTEADALADDVRIAIRNGTYVSAKTKKNTARERTPDAERVLMAAAITEFETDVIDRDDDKRAQTKSGDKNHLAQLAAFKTKHGVVGDLPVDTVDAETLTAFRRTLAQLANSTWAKYRTTIQQFFAWCKSKQYLSATPFEALAPHQKKALKRGQSTKRRRRVTEDEAGALLLAAGRTRADGAAVRLIAIIMAALETAMRLGELLALTWGDVDVTNKTIYVRAEEVGGSKTKQSRVVPMSGIMVELLTTLRTDPNGDRFGRNRYVFGDAVGGRVKKIRKAWITCVLRAHGHNPVWKKTALGAASAAKLREIDLHFHDLRHEAASRWLDSGVWTLEEIRQALGHTTVAQTATYLHAAGDSAIRAMQRFDAHRQQQTKTAPVAAAALPKPGWRVPKLSQNAASGDPTVAGPRLVKSDKARSRV